MLRILSKYSSYDKSVYYYIQRKKFFGWKDVTSGNSLQNSVFKFSSYDEAEQYIFKLNCNGITEINGNQYSYSKFLGYV